MKRKGYRRTSLRETLLKNQAASNFYATMAGKEPVESMIVMPADPKKRIKKINTSLDIDNSEAGVSKEVAKLLKSHPKVLLAVRQNGGSLMAGNVPVWFYRWVRTPDNMTNKMTITDFWGFTTDFKPFAIETKNRKWKKPSTSNEREMKQLEFINFIKKAGGKAGFASCLEDAVKILEYR